MITQAGAREGYLLQRHGTNVVIGESKITIKPNYDETMLIGARRKYYHGTPDIESYNLILQKGPIVEGRGFFLSPRKSEAKYWGEHTLEITINQLQKFCVYLMNLRSNLKL